MNFSDVPLGEAVDKVLADALDVQSTPLPMGEDMDARTVISALRDLVPGGVGKAGRAGAVADMAGVDRRTVQRIVAGTSPGSKRVLDKLRAAWNDQRRKLERARRRVVEAQKQTARDRLIKSTDGPTIKGVIVISGDSRPGRTIKLGPHLKAGSRGSIIAVHEAGGDTGAEMAAAISADYVPGMYVESVEEMTWT